MIKQQELTNPNSYINRAAQDEPVFVLCANDPLAAVAVREWARNYIVIQRQTHGTLLCEPGTKYKNKFDEAMGIADQMDTWRFQKKECS